MWSRLRPAVRLTFLLLGLLAMVGLVSILRRKIDAERSKKLVGEMRARFGPQTATFHGLRQYETK